VIDYDQYYPDGNLKQRAEGLNNSPSKKILQGNLSNPELLANVGSVQNPLS